MIIGESNTRLVSARDSEINETESIQLLNVKPIYKGVK